MWIINGFFLIIGLFTGFSVAAAVFALITSIGIVPRLSDKTHTGRYIRVYECAVLLGGSIGNVVFLYSLELHLATFLLGIIGLAFGLYVGCLAVALAEALNVTAVFSRRMKFHEGLGYITLFLALGKGIGSFYYFFKDVFTTIN